MTAFTNKLFIHNNRQLQASQKEMLLMTCAILLALYLVYFLFSEYLASKHLPPGPFPLPIIGNLHLLSSKPFLDFYRLSKTYGPVLRLQMGCNRVIVINNYKYAKEALMKRGTDFAGRPPHYVGDLFSRGRKSVGFQSYNDMQKLQRKIVIKTLKELERKSGLEQIVSTETRGLVDRIGNIGQCSGTSAIRVESTFASSNIVASIIFGRRFTEGDSDFLELLDAVTIFQESLAATNFLDAFPILKYFPFEIIDRVQRAIAQRDRILNKKYEELKRVYQKNAKTHSDGLLPPRSLAMTLLEEADADVNLSDDHIMMTMSDALIAGSETPATTTIWLLYYLIKYPDLQKRIQSELDQATGKIRTPKWSDRRDLHYLQGFVSEVLRHSSAMPFAIPHSTIRNTCLGPYQIPKGTTVILNVWAIHLDPEMWDSPMEFKPERYLDEQGRYIADRAAGILAFGLGHRSCPGETLAKMEAFLTTAQMLQKFDIRQVEGEVLPEITESSFGIVMRPAPFNICITLRNDVRIAH